MANLSELDALSRAVPNLNNRAAQQQQAAQRIQARQAVGQAQAPMSTSGLAQSVAAPLAQAQAQTAQQAQAQNQQALQQLGQQQIQGQQQQAADQLARQNLAKAATLNQAQLQAEAGLQRGAMNTEREITQKELAQARALQLFGIDQNNQLLQLNLKTRQELNDLGNDLEGKLFDSRRTFEKDMLGRKFSNERQLADAAVLTAQNQSDLQDKLQSIEMASQRKTMILQAAHEKLVRTLQSEAALSEAKLTTSQRKEIAAAAAQLEKDLAQQKARGEGLKAVFKGLAPIAATAVATAYGGPAAGAAAGTTTAQLVK